MFNNFAGEGPVFFLGEKSSIEIYTHSRTRLEDLESLKPHDFVIYFPGDLSPPTR